MATTSAFPVLNGVSLSGGSDATGVYNIANSNNPMYVGYMYGTTGSLANNRTNTTSSPIKTVIDNWYAVTINTKTDGTYIYDSYVSKTAIYCNDRATDLYKATEQMYYSPYDRLYTNKKPSYKCGNQYTGSLYSTADVADKFSVSTISGGNGQLTYPIALITADEVAYAGGVFKKSSKAWYHYNSVSSSVVGSTYWWTMSPTDSSGSFANVFHLEGASSPGELTYSSVHYNRCGARPVVSLKACASWKSGNGSSSSPYEVSIDSACAAAEN